MGPYAITILMGVAVTAFAVLAARKLVILRHLGREMRWDTPFARLATVVANGFLQSRMVRREWKPGLMHAAIFLGFIVLLVRKVELIAIGYSEFATLPGLFGGLFAALKDLIELLVLGACGYALYRRLVQRPRRLEENGEALLILSLIIAIMITDYLFDAFRFALLSPAHPELAHERAFAFLGSAFASTVSGLPAAVITAGYQTFYWLQLTVVFSFLVILPLGEHFHIVTALPTLFFRRGRPANTVPYIDVEKAMADETGEMRLGLRTALDLTWKEGLDVFTCTECGRCKDACPTFLTGKPLSQKWVNDGLKHHLLAEREAIVKAGEAALPALVPGVITDDTLWACTTCGYCEAACPIELEHLPRFFRMRQHRVMMDGEFPRELRAIFSAYEVQSNPWGLPAETRGDWATAHGVPVLHSAADAADIDYLFYVGSAESFDLQGQKIAGAFAKVMRAAGVRIAILGSRESSTGECVRRAGNEILFQQLAAALIATFAEFGIRRIVTCDPHAFNTLRNEYPALGGRYEVVHHTQLVAQLLAQGRLRVRPGSGRVAYHDPCYLGRHNGEYEAPRSILRAVTHHGPLEFPMHREKSMCCGAGGGRMWMEESIGKRINIARVEQALPLSPAIIATACPYCAVMMSDGLKARAEPGAVITRDVVELVADALEPVDLAMP
jgi:Fe-S oxidoreductase